MGNLKFHGSKDGPLHAHIKQLISDLVNCVLRCRIPEKPPNALTLNVALPFVLTFSLIGWASTSQLPKAGGCSYGILTCFETHEVRAAVVPIAKACRRRSRCLSPGRCAPNIWQFLSERGLKRHGRAWITKKGGVSRRGEL